jgi:hypothetical protein
LTYTIPLKEKIKSLMQEKLKTKKYNFSIEKLTVKGNNYMLVLKSVSGNYEFQQDKIDVMNFDAYFFN